MATINDSAGIFTGATLDAFNQMEALVARDGDQGYARQVMLRAMREVMSGQGTDSPGPTASAARQDAHAVLGKRRVSTQGPRECRVTTQTPATARRRPPPSPTPAPVDRRALRLTLGPTAMVRALGPDERRP